ncbi:MAG: hypothetical protein GY757_16890, partial [bacterium]|nr:hypothetical protein [bacterium]
MEYAISERIGDPDLFTGRKEELAFFLNWIKEIKGKRSKSTAILARRKTGKTALMERLFNITFSKNDGVIPFYYEVKETKFWLGDFCVDFFLTFIYQYIAFKTRNPEYITRAKFPILGEAKKAAVNEGLDYLVDIIEAVEYNFNNEHVDLLWGVVREAPKVIADSRNEFILQMIDEFQFLNAMMYQDKAKTQGMVTDTIAGGYLSTAESKSAPLLISGSWVGWLLDELITLLPSRFKHHFLDHMVEEEAVEMVFKYAYAYGVPVTEETAYMIAKISEGNPFYIISILCSSNRKKNLRTLDGLTETLEFETLDRRGDIRITWLDYLRSVLPRVNELNAKNIVLYLTQNSEREVTRKEIREKLNLDISDIQLEQKLKALIMSDLIEQGQSFFRYRGVRDTIFEKVFRGAYEEEIKTFAPPDIRKEYDETFQELKTKYHSLLGKHNRQKGYFAEYLIADRLRIQAAAKNEFLKSITLNLPEDFNFCTYSRAWKYDGSIQFGTDFNVDIFARAENPGDYSI